MVNPLPKKLIQEFCSKVKTVYVFEELEPVIEEQVKAWGYNVKGKEIFTRQGEYSANMLKKVLYNSSEMVFDKKEVPNRPPILCPGCPHRSVFSVLNKLKIHASGDIGCYTLGAVAPLGVIDSTLCMGASISSLHGIEKARGKEFLKNWVAVIGDSTFLHTGINSLINMVYKINTLSGVLIFWLKKVIIMRDRITLACTECKQRNYDSYKNKKNDPDRIEMKKYCKFCKKHTAHKETK